MKSKLSNRKKIHNRIRNKISGTGEIPRLHVFRSNKAIYSQLVDDLTGKTIVSASSAEVNSGGTKSEQAKEVGKLLGSKAKTAGISTIRFDRGGYLYHGRVKSLAEGAREEGLKF